MLDKAISVAIILFILSMISERFVTWVKIYFGKKGRRLFIFFNRHKRNLRKKPATKEEEKSIELQVLGLNLALSVLIACLAHADLFKIISTPDKALGWNNLNLDVSWNGLGNLFLSLLGCCFTGFFISLGSKFWHDLLDLLLYTKNLKQKLSDPATLEVKSVDQLTEYLNFNEADLVRLAIAQNEDALKAKFSNIHFLNDSIALINNEKRAVLGIHLFDNITAGLPDKVPVKLPSGKNYSVQTEIITHSGIVKITAGMDGSVANENSSSYKGSACCVAEDKDGKKYLVTNCHVLTEGYLQNPINNTGDDGVLYQDKTIGSWSFGSMDKICDFALVSLNNPDIFLSNNEVELFEDKFKVIENADILLEVVVRGNVSNNNAYVLDIIDNKIKIEYNLGHTITFEKAFLLGNQPDRQNCSPPSDHGDSGGAVYTKDKKLIGIIAGKNNRFSVVLPVQKILSNLSLKTL